MGKIAIIGGTGLRPPLERPRKEEMLINYSVNGESERNVFRFTVGRTPGGTEIVYFNRHNMIRGDPKYRRPDTIDYKTYMIGLQRLGVKNVLSTSAVGSAKEDITPGSVVIPSDYFDFTDSDVAIDIGKEYADMSKPFGLRQRILRAQEARGFEGVYEDGFYICLTKGTTFETPLEVRKVRDMFEEELRDGTPLVFGMTVPPEAKLVRIMGMKYGCLAVVSNMAAGMGKKITHGGNERVVREANKKVKQILLDTVDSL